MQKTDILIIGGSVAGLTAAISARRNYPDKKIVLIRKEKQVLIPCAIPYICQTIGSIEKDLINDEMLSKNNIELVVDEVLEIDKKAGIVKTIQKKEFEYEKLILATGSLPIIPPIPGADLENIFTVKKDADYLKGVFEVLEKANDIVIIGGGFIGLEFADELSKKDKNITIVEMLPHCLEIAYDKEFCLKAEAELKNNRIEILTNSIAEKIGGEKKVEYVKLKNGKEIKADAIILGIGARANIKIAQVAGLKIGEKKAIAVDEFQKTSDENIFAIGDCAEKKSFFNGEISSIMLASIAAREARIASANLFRLNYENKGTIGTFATVVGNLAIGISGLSESHAKEAKIDFVKSEASTFDKHPGVMPNSSEIFVKLLFKKSTSEIIGGQISSGATAGEIINIIAAMIQNKMKAEEVVMFQLGTHPALTPSPIVYPIVNAAEMAIKKI